MDSALVLHVDEKDVVGSPDDILTRRLKNRERQRRYRAKKRHEADMKKALVVGYSTPMQCEQTPADFPSAPVQVEISTTPPSSGFLTQVYCQRDWKKDARRAHLYKTQQVKSVALNNSEASNPGVTPAPSWESSVAADKFPVHSITYVQGNDETQRSMSNRRHWKTEARNKKGSE